MVNQTYGSGAFQLLLQAVPVTALVCAATIALLLLFVRILAQSLASSQHRQMQEDTPSRLHPGHFPHFQPREYDPYWMSPTFGSPGPARALDFMNSSSPSSSLDASGFGSFNSSPRMPCRNNLTETLCVEVASKALECGEHPSLTLLCLNLIHHYTLDVNQLLPPRGLNIFHQACRSGSPRLVSSILPLADVSRPTMNGETPLYLAVQAAAERTMISEKVEDLEVVKLLLERGGNVDTATYKGITPLQEASRRGCTSLVRLLLDWGAAVDKVWGTSPSPTGGDLHASEADSPPSSHWDYKYKTSTPSVHSADSEDTLADFLDVKLEASSSSTVALGVRRKRRKSKSPKFTVVTRSMARAQEQLAITMVTEDSCDRVPSLANGSSVGTSANSRSSDIYDLIKSSSRKSSSKKK